MKLTATLIDSKSKDTGESEIFVKSILTYFGSIEVAKDAYDEYVKAWNEMGEWPCSNASIDTRANYLRWTNAVSLAEYDAFASWDTTDGEYFEVFFSE